MIDKQRLIYDLSLQCAVLEVQRDRNNPEPLPKRLLEAFVSAATAYRAMCDDTINAALEELKNTLP